MASDSKIEWTDHTFNGWWGCQKVHAGCANCYAEATDHRWGGDHWGPKQPRRFILGEWSKPARWQREAAEAGVMRRVFASSMCDVFEDYDGPMIDVHGNRVDHTLDSCRASIFEMIEQTPNLIWLLLTKRPENVTRMVPGPWLDVWPSNVMTGTSPCDQHTADKCIPALLKVPGKRFLSMEPLLGAVDLRLYCIDGIAVDPLCDDCGDRHDGRCEPGIHWVIVGGESGGGARPMHPDWVRSIRDQCAAAGVPFFFKQWGAWVPQVQAHPDALTPKTAANALYVAPDGSTRDANHGARGDSATVQRVGKKAAGQLLDGVEHNGMPGSAGCAKPRAAGGGS